MFHLRCNTTVAFLTYEELEHNSSLVDAPVFYFTYSFLHILQPSQKLTSSSVACIEVDVSGTGFYKNFISFMNLRAIITLQKFF